MMQLNRFAMVLITLAGGCLGLSQAQAQIVPDTTLGEESSVVVPNVEINGLPSDRIEGGAIRDSVLFHSFSEFDIEVGRGAYFANPGNINTIFSRVTGNDPSNLMGTLGVLGSADLVFLNPNGILFGPNAQLDLQGAFTATTASEVVFPDGQRFGALAPGSPPILTVNVQPVVELVFEGPNRTITNQGILETRDSINLSAGNLDLQNSVIAGNALNLEAQNRVRFSDTFGELQVQAGEDLLIRGGGRVNAAAVADANSLFSAERDLIVQSPVRQLSGVATHEVGGYFRAETLNGALVDFVIPHDQVIIAPGDVQIDDAYIGGSLHILAGGSVSTGIESETALPITLNAGGSGTVSAKVGDGLGNTQTIVVTAHERPTLDIRAGINWTAMPDGVLSVQNTTGVPVTFSRASGADITLGDVTSTGNESTGYRGGTVMLSNQFQPNRALADGDIAVEAINTSSFGEVLEATNGLAELFIEGGDVVVDARDSVVLNSTVNTSAEATVGVKPLFDSAFLGADGIDTFGNLLNIEDWVVGDATVTVIGGDTQIQADGAIALQEIDAEASIFVGVRDAISGDSLSSEVDAVAIGGNISLLTHSALSLNSISTSAILDASIYAGDKIGKLPGEPPDSVPPGIIGIPVPSPFSTIGIEPALLIGPPIITPPGPFDPNPPDPTEPPRTSVVGGEIGNLAFTTLAGSIAIHANSSINVAEQIDSFTETNVDVRAHAIAGSNENSIDVVQGGEIGDIDIIAEAGTIDIETDRNLQINDDIRFSTDVNLNASATAIESLIDQDLNPLGGRIADVSISAAGGTLAVNSNNKFSTTYDFNAAVDVQADINSIYGLDFLPGVDSSAAEVESVTALAQGSNVNILANQIFLGGDLYFSSNTVIDRSAPADSADLIATATAQGGHVSIVGENNLTNRGDINTSADSSFNFVYIGPGVPVGLPPIFEQDDNLIFSDPTIDLVTAFGGDVTLSSSNRININASDIRTSANNGDAGDIQVQGNNISLNNSSLISLVTSRGTPGQINVDGIGQVNINDSLLSARLESGTFSTQSSLNQPSIQIRGRDISLTNFAFLNTTSTENLDAGGIQIDADNSILLNDSNIFSLTTGSGNAGDISLISDGTIEIVGNSVISTASGLGASGNSGDVHLEAAEQIRFFGTGTPLNLSGEENLPVRELNVSRPYLPDPGNSNSSAESAFNIRTNDFALDNTRSSQNPDILFPDQTPYTSVGVEENGAISSDNPSSRSENYYRFNVDSAGTKVVFDVDNVVANDSEYIVNTELTLYSLNANGSVDRVLANNDNASTRLGASGSSSPRDAYLDYVFSEPGNYILLVESQLTSPKLSIAGNNSPGSENYTYNFDLNISRTENFLVSSGISAQTRDAGRAGSVDINTPILTVANGAQISAVTSGAGAGGNITVNASETLRLQDNSQLAVESSDAGQAGNVVIDTGLLTVESNAIISATSTETATGQEGGRVTLNAPRMNLFGTVGIFAETQGQVPAGALILTSGEQSGDLAINFNNPDPATQTQLPRISASTTGSGDGGNLMVMAPNSIDINGNGTLAVETTGIGDAGNAEFRTQQLTLRNGATVSASTSGVGSGGGISIDATNLNISDGSQVLSRTAGAGDAGGIDIFVDDDFIITGRGSGLFANTTRHSSGNGGSIFIDPDRVLLSDRAGIAVNSQGTGDGGRIDLSANHLSLSNNSFISAETVSSTGEGISLDVRTLNVQNSDISASTATGSAGQLRVDASESIILNGVTAAGEGGLRVEATNGGIAGGLIINTDELRISQGAEASVSSPAGVAGNLNIRARDVRLDQGTILAETGRSLPGIDSAVINLIGLDFLLLANESLISASALELANGGNITIDADFIVANAPTGPNGSDIIARAVDGNGGRINITTTQLFNIAFRENLTPLNDITASSDFGIDGVVDINSVNLDPTQGLNILPAEAREPAVLSGCYTGGGEEAVAFYDVGFGGRPPSPEDAQGSNDIVAVWIDLNTGEADEDITASEAPDNSEFIIATDISLPTTLSLQPTAYQFLTACHAN